MSAPVTYTSTGEALKARILALIPTHPEILGLDSAWGLLKVPGFDCTDLGPSLGQATWALSAAQREYAAGIAR